MKGEFLPIKTYVSDGVSFCCKICFCYTSFIFLSVCMCCFHLKCTIAPTNVSYVCIGVEFYPFSMFMHFSQIKINIELRFWIFIFFFFVLKNASRNHSLFISFFFFIISDTQFLIHVHFQVYVFKHRFICIDFFLMSKMRSSFSQSCWICHFSRRKRNTYTW